MFTNEDVIYKLCVKIILNRYGSNDMQQFIEYNTAVRHNIDLSADHEIPKNLLKIDDLQNTYTELLKLKSFTKTVVSRN